MKFSKSLTLLGAAVLIAGCTETTANEAADVKSSATEASTSKPQAESTSQASSKPIKPGSEQVVDRDQLNAEAKKMFAQAPAGEYGLDKKHGYITFSYLHQGYSKPYLRWRDWDSTLNWDPSNPENSSVSVTINVASIDSGVDDFDDHLRSADFFDAENYPTITFESTSLTRDAGMTGQMTGNLTVKDITAPVTLDVTFNKGGEARGGGHKIGFSATTQLLRSEWGVGKYVPFVGDEVDLVIEVEYDKPAAAE